MKALWMSFLREELNYVVVESWVAAEQGVRLLKSGVDGRATFLIHPAEQGGLFAEDNTTITAPGVIPLKDSIRVLNGFGRPLESILPKLKHGYLAEDSSQAQQLAAQYPYAYFLTPEGECFHNATVTGGKPASEGPLALKREFACDRRQPCQAGNRINASGGRSLGIEQGHRRAGRATGSAQRRAAAG